MRWTLYYKKTNMAAKSSHTIGLMWRSLLRRTSPIQITFHILLLESFPTISPRSLPIIYLFFFFCCISCIVLHSLTYHHSWRSRYFSSRFHALLHNSVVFILLIYVLFLSGLLASNLILTRLVPTTYHHHALVYADVDVGPSSQVEVCPPRP